MSVWNMCAVYMYMYVLVPVRVYQCVCFIKLLPNRRKPPQHNRLR